MKIKSLVSTIYRNISLYFTSVNEIIIIVLQMIKATDVGESRLVYYIT